MAGIGRRAERLKGKEGKIKTDTGGTSIDCWRVGVCRIRARNAHAHCATPG